MFKLSTKNIYVRKAISSIALVAFFFNTFALPVRHSYAQELFQLPQPGVLLNLSPAFTPPLLKGVKVYPDNPFRLDFILDKGNSAESIEDLKTESTRLIKYFLASVTVPENDLWVNLSPYEKDRIIPNAFGVTEMGRDLLAQDYILKQLTASMIYPEEKIGKEFWDRVYEEARKRYGTADIPIDTFNKVWIVPAKATVYETKDSAYVIESRLKVLLDEDYLALEKGTAGKSDSNKAKETSKLGSEIVREIVIPILEKEVNEGKNFAQLRQVYQSLILAIWFKDKIRESLFGKVYVDQEKTGGVDIADKAEKDKIWARYVEAFKKGAYNYIKEDYDPVTEEIVARKYFSGGAGLNRIRGVYEKTKDRGELPEGVSDNAMVVQSILNFKGPLLENRELEEEIKNILDTSQYQLLYAQMVASQKEGLEKRDTGDRLISQGVPELQLPNDHKVTIDTDSDLVQQKMDPFVATMDLSTPKVIAFTGPPGSGKSVYGGQLMNALVQNTKLPIFRFLPGMIFRFVGYILYKENTLPQDREQKVREILSNIHVEEVGGVRKLFYNTIDIIDDPQLHKELSAKDLLTFIAQIASEFQTVIMDFSRELVSDQIKAGGHVVLEGREYSLNNLGVSYLIRLVSALEGRVQRKIYERIADCYRRGESLEQAVESAAKELSAFPVLTKQLIKRGALSTEGKTYDEILSDSIGVLSPSLRKRLSADQKKDELDLFLVGAYLPGPFRNKDTRGKPEWDNSIKYLKNFIKKELAKIHKAQPEALSERDMQKKEEEAVALLNALIEFDQGKYWDVMTAAENVASVQRIVKLVVFGNPEYSEYDENPVFRVSGANANRIAKKALKGSHFQELADSLPGLVEEQDIPQLQKTLEELFKIAIYAATPKVDYTNLDFQTDEGKAVDFVRKVIGEAKGQRFSFNSVAHFIQNVLLSKKPMTVLFLPDDVGDSVAHLYLIQQYMKSNANLKFVLLPKSRQYGKDLSFNDLVETLDRDANEGGLLSDFNRFVKEGRIVISQGGSAGAGINLKDLNDEGARQFKEADCVMSVGQTYFETLNGLKKDIYHFFSLESIIAKTITGAPIGTFAFAHVNGKYYHVYAAEGAEPAFTLSDYYSERRYIEEGRKEGRFDRENQVESLHPVWLLDFMNPLSQNTFLTGGKAAVLSNIIQHNFSDFIVYPGFTVTTEATRELLSEPGIRGKLNKLTDQVVVWHYCQLLHARGETIFPGTQILLAEFQKQTEERINNLARDIQTIIVNGGFSPEFLEAFQNKLRHYEKNFPGAVFIPRSSAPNAEDLPDASFAGQQDSMPNLSGTVNVLDGVKRVIASLFSERAIMYRITQQANRLSKELNNSNEEELLENIERWLSGDDLSPLNVSMAVPVQLMVKDPRASGVVFSMNPEDGSSDIRVEATIGFGSNVDGLVTPDVWIVDPRTFEIKSKTLGRKVKKFIAESSGGMKVIDALSEEESSYSLSDAEVVQAAKAVLAVRDLQKWNKSESEFAIDQQGKLVINQARPETTGGRAGESMASRRIVDANAVGNATALVRGGMRGYVNAVHLKVQVVENLEDFMESNQDALVDADTLIVAPQTNASWNTLLLRSGGMVTEAGGITCHTAIVSREWKKPAIIGMPNAIETFSALDGQWVTLDPYSLSIYQGKVSLIDSQIDLRTMPKVNLGERNTREHRRNIARKGGYTDEEGIWMKAPRHPLGALVMDIFQEGYVLLGQYFNLPMHLKTEHDTSRNAQYQEDLLWVRFDDRDGIIQYFEKLSNKDLYKIFFEKLRASQDFVEKSSSLGTDLNDIKDWLDVYAKHMQYRHLAWNLSVMFQERLKISGLSDIHMDAMTQYLREGNIPPEIKQYYSSYSLFPLETEKMMRSLSNISDFIGQDEKLVQLFKGHSPEVVLNALQEQSSSILNQIRQHAQTFKVLDSTDPRITLEEKMIRVVKDIQGYLKATQAEYPEGKKDYKKVLAKLTPGQFELLMMAVLDSLEKDNALHLMVRQQEQYVQKLYALGDRLAKEGLIADRRDVLEMKRDALLAVVRAYQEKLLTGENGRAVSVILEEALQTMEVSSQQVKQLTNAVLSYFDQDISSDRFQKKIQTIIHSTIAVAHHDILMLHFFPEGFKDVKIYLRKDADGNIKQLSQEDMIAYLQEQGHENCVLCRLLFDLPQPWNQDESASVHVIGSTESFIIRPDDHPVSEGHILILPKEHVTSMAKLSPKARQEIEKLKDKIRKIFKDVYKAKDVLFFEHGEVGLADARLLSQDEVTVQSPVSHAHLHAIPLTEDVDFIRLLQDPLVQEKLPVTKEGLHFQKANSFWEAADRNGLRELKYLYFETMKGGAYFAVNLPEGARQFMRLLAGSALGKWEAADWRKGYNSEALRLRYDQMLSSIPVLAEKLRYDVVENIPVEDYAMVTQNPSSKGGIDLTRDKVDLRIQGSGQGVQFNFEPAVLQQLQNASGLTPVIIDIYPMTTTVPMFLGLRDDAKEMASMY